MLASCTIDHVAWNDPKVLYLAQLAKYADGVDTAIGKLSRLWARCTFLGTDVVPELEVNSCMGAANGVDLLLAAGLAERTPGGIRVKGRFANQDGKDRLGWFHDTQKQQVVAGRARASGAQRNSSGRFQPASRAGVAGPAESSASQPLRSGSDHSPDLSLVPPELPDPRASDRAQIGTGLTAATLTADLHRPVTDRDERRRRLIRDAWNYAATKHAELKHGDGLSPTSPNWGAAPSASSEPVKALIARVDELLVADDFAEALETIRRRVDVAAAIAKRDKHLDWFIPARMWDGKSFAIDAALSPQQVAAQKSRAGPRGTRSDDDESAHETDRYAGKTWK